MVRRTLLILLMLIPAAAAGGVTVEFTPDGAVVRFDEPTRVLRMELTAPGFRLVEPMHDRPVLRHRLFFKTAPTRYTFRVFTRDAEHPLVVRRRPTPDALEDVSMLIEAPYTGRADITRRWGRTAPADVPLPGTFTASLQLMSWRRWVSGRLEVTLPEGVRLAGKSSAWITTRRDGITLLRRLQPLLPMQVVRHTFRLAVRADAAAGPLVTARFVPSEGVDLEPVERTLQRRRMKDTDLAALVNVVRIDMPTDPRGVRDVRKPVDTLVLPSRAGLAVRRLFGLAEKYRDYDAPFTRLTVLLENRGAESVPVVVRMHVSDVPGGEPLDGFQPPDYRRGPDGRLSVTVQLDPGVKTPVVLPVFVREGRPLAGSYRAHVDVCLFGTEAVLGAVEHPFGVRTADVRALVVTMLAILLSVVALVVFLVRQRKIFKAFRVSELVLIALFATMTFVLVIFPGSLLGPLFSAVAGPFAFLVQGIFFEVLRVLVLVALLVLVPRVGTVTLTYLVRYLIGGLVFGGFTPVDLFYLGASVVLMEVLLWVLGITSRRGTLVRREFKARSFLHVALVMGGINAATQYVIYCLNISFYRLYFADWFIWLSVIVSGFLYAALGTLPGLQLGRRLRRISE